MMDTSSPSASAERELPHPTQFVPGNDSLPPTLGEEASKPGAIVLLLNASEGPLWAADVAVAMASAWGQAGRRIVLADLHFEAPVLHERVEAGNHDGVVDIFLYGASLRRSARPVRGQGFYLIPAGTYTDDPAAIFHHPRWAKLSAGFRDAGASLLLFVPAAAPELEALARWSTGAILLGEPEKGPAVVSRLPPGTPLYATLTPPPAPPPAPAPEESVPDEEIAAAVVPEANGPEPGERAVPQPSRPQPDAAARSVPDTLDEAAPPSRSPARPLAVAALLITLLVGGAYLAVHLDLFGLGTADRAAGPAAARTGAADPAAAVPTGVALPYAVHLRAFRTLSAAQNYLTQEERRLRGQPAYIAPELIQGVRWFRVLVGLPADSAAAVRLRERLVESGAIDRDDIAGSLTLIQYTPLAFLLGDFTSQQSALDEAEALLELGVPSYPVAFPYSDGSSRWRLYGGAYADSAQAQEMQALLTAADMETSLVERVGQPLDSDP